MKNIKNIKRIVISLLVFLVVLFCAGTLYASIYYHAQEIEVIKTALESDEVVAVSEFGKNIIFEPMEEQSQIGIIFYPGAKVEETAYAPLCNGLAKEGYFSALIHMPARLAVLNINAADKIIKNYPNIKQWYIMGHSLGGAMAANYSKSNMDRLQGLILLGAYSTDDLSGSQLSVLSLYGDKDMVVNKENIETSRAYMPESYEEIILEGGNHANYGYYGEQKGDGTATISNEEQQKIVIEHIKRMLGSQLLK